MSKFQMDPDYIDVAERITAFRDKHPEGSLQSEQIQAPEGFVAMRAYAYRSPDDPRPGIGHAWEPFPGKTPYTRDSELQNAETSAWGRAIVAALAADTKRGIASADEVRNREEDRASGGSPTAPNAGTVGHAVPAPPSGPEGYGEGSDGPPNVEGEATAPAVDVSGDNQDGAASPSHEPNWIQSPKLKSHEVCETCLGTDSWEHQPRRKKAS